MSHDITKDQQFTEGVKIQNNTGKETALYSETKPDADNNNQQAGLWFIQSECFIKTPSNDSFEHLRDTGKKEVTYSLN